jgi:protein gp37
MPRHTWMLLTKRPAELGNKIRRIMLDRGWRAPLANVLVGTTIEHVRNARRVDSLRALPAAVRYISAEPLFSSLDAVDLAGVDWVICGGESGSHARPSHPDWFRELRDRCVADGRPFHFKQWGEWLPSEQAYIGQPVVLRADSGRWLQDDGSPAAGPSSAAVYRVGKKAAGHLLDGVEWHQFPEAVTA